MRKVLLAAVALLSLVSMPGFAQKFPEKPSGFVNDYAGMMSADMRQRLERALSVYRDSTSNVIVVATFEDLQGYSVEEFATKVFNTWRMWEGDRYNGVLILASKNDRKLRIEVGYGLEGAVPDALAGRILDNELKPRFRQGDFDGGFAAAAVAVMKATRGEYKGTGKKRGGKGGFSEEAFALIFMAFLFLILIVVPLAARAGRKGRAYRRGGSVDINPFLIASILHDISRASRGGGGGWGGGGGGGGFGGFGGGGGFGSGGGGASGGW